MTDLNKLLGHTQSTQGKQSPYKENNLKKNSPKKIGGKPPLTLLQLTDCEDDELDQSAEMTGIN